MTANLIRTASLALISASAAGVASCGSSSDSPNDRVPDDHGPAGSGSPDGGSTDPKHEEPPRVPPSYRDFDVNHVLGTGQSLSLGLAGTPALSTTQPFSNTMFDTGLVPTAVTPRTLAPLLETSSMMGVQVETPSSGMANLIAQIAQQRYGLEHDVLVSLHGVSGASYPMIEKGTEAFQHGLDQVRAAKAIADAEHKTYVVRAVTIVHGESDGWQNWNREYDRAMLAFQADYDAGVREITGQAIDVPLFQSQYSAWSSVESDPQNVIPALQLAAHVQSAGKVILVGPKYQLPYADDGFHLTNEGYRWLGEYYAKAYVRHVIEGKAWEPLRPREIVREGATVRLRFFVPSPPLVLDTEKVTDPGHYGFEIADPGGATIDSVAVTGGDTIELRLTGLPAAGARVRYAFTATPGTMGGPRTGPRGNLRDSDATTSRVNEPLYNWCVHFDEPVP